MKRIRASIGALVVALALVALGAAADKPEWGLIEKTPGMFDGFTLFAPNGYTTVYLINADGKVVHTWGNGLKPGISVYLLEDGRLLRAIHRDDNTVFGKPPFGGGRVQILGWDGKVEWDYRMSDDLRYQHHDIRPMPNGNVLLLVWEFKTEDEAIAAGRDPFLLSQGKLFPETIVEVKPTGPTSGDIVWEWKLWDHLIQDHDGSKANYGVVSEHPERLDVNYILSPGADWNHSNGIDYNAELDQIVISMRSMDEIYVIDHSTTTEEARGHTGGKQGKGGDFLYRWGNPRAYERGAAEDQRLFKQHNPHWIAPGLPGAGNILVFNNGNDRPGGNHSSVDEIVPPVSADGRYEELRDERANGPAEPLWSYKSDPTEDFYSHFISGAQRLPNGNTLICSGAQSMFFEVTPKKKVVWRYRAAFGRPDAPKSSGGMLEDGAQPPDAGATAMRGIGVFRAVRYSKDYPGLAGKGL